MRVAAPAGAGVATGPGASRVAMLPPALLAVVLVVGVALLYSEGNGLLFYYDEWNFIQDRRAWTAGALLEPHNEHAAMLPALVYKLLFSAFGIEGYGPYRAAGLGFHVVVCVLLFVYVRRRVGPWSALTAATLILGFGPGWADVLWPFQIGYLGSLAAGLGALLALDRRDRSGDAAAAALVAASLSSSSLGLPVLAAVTVDLLLSRGRRAPVWVAATPAMLYALWYLAYRPPGDFKSGNIVDTPAYVAEAAGGAMGALLGLGSQWGRPAVVLGLALLAFRLAGRRAEPRLVALGVLAVGFWGLTGLARADVGEPGASRYLYPGAVFILLVGAEGARGVRPGRAATVILGVVLAGALITNAGAVRDGANTLAGFSDGVTGSLRGFELAGAGVDPELQVDPEGAPQIRAGRYRAAVAELGSPVAPGATLAAPPLWCGSRPTPRWPERSRSRLRRLPSRPPRAARRRPSVAWSRPPRPQPAPACARSSVARAARSWSRSRPPASPCSPFGANRRPPSPCAASGMGSRCRSGRPRARRGSRCESPVTLRPSRGWPVSH